MKHGARLALTLVVTWFILDRVGFNVQELQAMEIGSMRPHALGFAASVTLLLMMYFVSAAIWGRIVVDLGGPSIPMARAVRLFMIANLGRYIPGKVWQIAGLAALAKGQGVSAVTATGAAVLGQGLAVAAAGSIGLGALLTGSEALRQAGMVGGVLVAVGIGLMAIPSVFERGVALWFRLARTDPPESLGSAHGIRWFIFYLMNWMGYALSFWLLVTSFGMPVPLIPTTSAFAAAYVLGYLMIFAPAGLGVREGFLVAFLTPHVGIVNAGAISVIHRIWITGVEVVPAGVFWLMHLRETPVDKSQGVAPNE